MKDWKEELRAAADIVEEAVFWPKSEMRNQVEAQIKYVLSRKGFVSERLAGEFIGRLTPRPLERILNSHAEELGSLKTLCDKLGIYRLKLLSSETRQGTTFTAIHKSSKHRVIIKLSNQEVPHRVPSAGWGSSDDAIVEGKILCYASEAARVFGERHMPQFFGQFICTKDSQPISVMIQEFIELDISRTFKQCSHRPLNLVSFFIQACIMISAMHAASIIHNDLHSDNVRARSTPRPGTVASPRDGTVRQLLCPFDLYAIDFGLACVRHSVCAISSASEHGGGSRAFVDILRFITTIDAGSPRSNILDCAVRMLVHDSLSSSELCALLSLIHALIAATSVWCEPRRRWLHPFGNNLRPVGGDYWLSVEQCVRPGNSLPFASDYYLLSSRLGPLLLESLPLAHGSPSMTIYTTANDLFR